MPYTPGVTAQDHHSHSHSHGHDHGLEGGWAAWMAHPVLRVVLGAIVACGIATVAAVAALWPDGVGRDAALAEAQTYGLASDRLAAVVESVTDAACSYQGTGVEQSCRSITVFMEEGPDAGSIVALPEFGLDQGGIGATVQLGDELIVGYEPSTDFYFFADRDRRASLGWLVVAFAAVVVALGRKRGLLALAAMTLTVVVLVAFVAPSVLDGNDPLLVCLVAASVIAFASLYLTHGFSPTTTVALAGTLMALLFTLLVSAVFFRLAQFSGLASEEGLTIPIVAGNIDLVGLLLGGAMIGALGALDDVTVTQVATVAELKRRSPELSAAELVTSGIRVGREHIASTVNTLLLAYAGASMPLLLLFAISDQSLGIVANSEVVAIEIVRTLCGSIGLVAAVPLTTALAAVVVAGAQPSSTQSLPVGPSSAPTGPAPTGPDAAPVRRPAPSWDDFAPGSEPDF